LLNEVILSQFKKICFSFLVEKGQIFTDFFYQKARNMTSFVKLTLNCLRICRKKLNVEITCPFVHSYEIIISVVSGIGGVIPEVGGANGVGIPSGE
jgi:hypothetical protein